MKFLAKQAASAVAVNNMKYKAGQNVNNRKILELLLAEQKGFCAYTELYLLNDAFCPEVEHFDASQKGNDGYRNYYAVSRYINNEKRKKDISGTFADALFFKTLFFQNREQLYARIEYRDGFYKPADGNDEEARQFIDYIGLDDIVIKTRRDSSIRRIRNQMALLNEDEQRDFFRNETRDLLSFPTALEHEFNIDLSEIINNTP